jgi:hypothetical protein
VEPNTPTAPLHRGLDTTGEKIPTLSIDLGADDRNIGAGARIRCLACGQTITHRRDSIEVSGAHVHRCTNPADIVYEIGCFRAACGVIEAGNAISRRSWFSGYAWRLSLCAECGSHLGWAFRAHGVTYFYGLILKRLTADD